MLYAKRNINKRNIQMYILLLNDLINGNNEVKPLFISLYEDTKGIVDNNITFYNIKNRNFVPLIEYLVNEHSQYFKEINVDTLENEDFSELKTYLEDANI